MTRKPERQKCPVPHCLTMILRSQVMCQGHWFRVPQELRDEIWDSYDARQQGTQAHFGLCMRAVRTVYKEEQRAATDKSPEVCEDILGLVDVIVEPGTLAGWTEEQRKEAIDWASAVHLSASDNEGIVIPTKPAHVPLSESEKALTPAPASDEQ